MHLQVDVDIWSVKPSHYSIGDPLLLLLALFLTIGTELVLRAFRLPTVFGLRTDLALVSLALPRTGLFLAEV